MGTLVISGAPVPDAAVYSAPIRSCEFLVAVDSGADVCLACGRVPDLFVGDADSVSADALAWLDAHHVARVDLSADKDVSDLEVALGWLESHRPGAVDLACWWGGRVDHSLAVIGTLFSHPALRAHLLAPPSEGWLLDASHHDVLALPADDRTISVLAGPRGALVSLSGFRWNLDRAHLGAWSDHGVGNHATSPAATVRLHEGHALILATDGNPT